MPSSRSPSVAGLVEVLDSDTLTGWLQAAEPGTQISLLVNDMVVTSTTAAEPASRAGTGTVFGFELALTDLWDFVGPPDRIAVHAAGAALPIAGHGMFLVPPSAGEHSAADLASRLERGEVFTRDGRLALPQSLDRRWQVAALDLYAALRAEVADAIGEDVTLAYGTLLGVVRDGDFIGRDIDLDAAYISADVTGPAAAAEARSLALTLIDRGYAVRATPTSLQVRRPDDPSVQVTLYHLFVDATGALRFPFGTVGEPSPAGRPALHEHDFRGVGVLVPVDADSMLAQIYGPDWRMPDPHFRWSRARRHRAPEAELPPAAVEEIYWAGFYARTTFDRGSTFFELVSARADLPATVIDLGCGDGRDSFAFASAGGRSVTGLDRSHVGIRQAQRKTQQLGLDENLRFAACDVSDVDALRDALADARHGSDPLLYYARFFLHSVPEEVQRTLLTVIAGSARAGDVFAAEFRTERDELAPKIHGDHYRRFQNGPAFGRVLERTYGFAPFVEQEGNGFSPYRGEDPCLYRVIARRA